jgi:AcrR family transcriptional regulator
VSISRGAPAVGEDREQADVTFSGPRRIGRVFHLREMAVAMTRRRRSTAVEGGRDRNFSRFPLGRGITEPMRDAKASLEPQQERSRESLQKLLKAATEVLGQRGVEGTTIPRIAQHAGLTPGAVYRRFRDKDALLEAAILGILERQDERLKAGLTPDMAAKIPLDVFAEQLVGGMVTTYRAHASLLRACRQFTLFRADSVFAKKVTKLEVRTFERVVDLVLAGRKDIRHPNPRVAVTLGLWMIVGTLYELVVMPSHVREWKKLLPKDDQSLKRELTRAFLSYVEAETGHGAPATTKGPSRAPRRQA